MNSNSRYAKGTSVWVDHPIEGRVQAVHLAPLVWTNYPYTRMQASVADSMTSIAQLAYGHATDYWFVASMNPHVASADDLMAGDIVHVPTDKIW